MGSFSVENSTRDGTTNKCSYQDLRVRRPDFYPCPDCGRRFTLRAMEIHQRSCFETEDCVCLVCKTGVKKKWSLKLENEDDTLPLETERGVILKPKLRDLLTGKINNLKNRKINKANSKIITFTLLDENLCAIEKIVTGDKSLALSGSSIKNSSGNVAFDDHKCVLTPSESSGNSSPTTENVECSPNKSFTPKSEKYEDHDGEPCDRKLYCCVCNEHIFWEAFGLHVIQHCKTLENNYLKCPECSKSYSKPALFLIHFYVHVSSHPVDCTDCSCGHPQCTNASNHTDPDHSYVEAVPFHCYICLNRFSHGQTIVNHMRLHSKEMPFTCTECNRSFRQIGNLQRHMTTHRGERPHKCPNCVRSFADPATLRNHVRVHTGETPFVCSICNRGFTQVGNLKRHMALHLQKDVSSNSLSSTVEMVSDQNIVSVVSSSEDIKVDTFNSSNDSNGVDTNNSALISTSVENNTSVTDTTQDTSVAAISPSDSNNVHRDNKFSPYNIRKNRKEKIKVFTCNICKKVYTWQHDLAIHFRTHTGEKPYKCEICDKRFAQSGAVRIHKIRHHTNSAIGRSRWKNKV